MSDERDPRPDETRKFSPFDGGADDETHVGQPGAAADQPTGAAGTGDDPTVVTPQEPAGDGTSVLPPVRDWSTRDAWAGRAEVRPPRPEDYVTSSDWDAEPPPPEPSGRWWTPIVIGIVALVLVGLLGWGIYLITTAEDGGDTPAPGPTVTVTNAPAPTTAATTASQTPSPTPTTTAPTTEPTLAEVTVPALVGLAQQEAQQALDGRGLPYRLLFRPSDAPAGTVIDSDPPEGQEVPPGTLVTLVIATAPSTEPGSPSASVTSAGLGG